MPRKLHSTQGIWIGTPWSVSLQNSGHFWNVDWGSTPMTGVQSGSLSGVQYGTPRAYTPCAGVPKQGEEVSFRSPEIVCRLSRTLSLSSHPHVQFWTENGVKSGLNLGNGVLHSTLHSNPTVGVECHLDCYHPQSKKWIGLTSGLHSKNNCGFGLWIALQKCRSVKCPADETYIKNIQALTLYSLHSLVLSRIRTRSS